MKKRVLKSFKLDEKDEVIWNDFVAICQIKGVPAYKRLMHLVQRYVAEEDPRGTLRDIGK